MATSRGCHRDRHGSIPVTSLPNIRPPFALDHGISAHSDTVGSGGAAPDAGHPVILPPGKIPPQNRKEKIVRSVLLPLRTLMILVVVLASAPFARAAPFTINNLVVVRVGNGTTALDDTAAAVSLLEFTQSGTVVAGSQINFATSGSDAFTLSGSAVSEGILTSGSVTSAPYLTLAGYNRDVGQSNPQTENAATTNRVVARVGFDGSVDTSTKLSSAFSSLSVRSAATNDGTNLWVAGQNGATGGLHSTTLGASSTTAVGSNSNDLRQVQVVNGNLFVGGSEGTPGRAVFKVGRSADSGTGANPNLPTQGSPTFVNANTIDPSGKTYNSFYFTNLGSENDWNSTGFDTLYALNSATGVLEKYSYDGTDWLANSSIISSGILNLAGVTSGKNVVLYVTSSSSLSTIVDTSGHNVAINGTLTSIASAGSGFAFRGVAIVPEPGSLALCGLAGAGLVGFILRRRKTKVVAI